MYDPFAAARAFAEGYGLEPISLADRAHAASGVTLAGAEIAQSCEQAVEAVWELNDLLESGGIDEVLLEAYVRVAEKLGDLLLDVYGVAHRLRLERIYEVVGELHRARMSALGTTGPLFRDDGKIIKQRGYMPPVIKPLVPLPA